MPANGDGLLLAGASPQLEPLEAWLFLRQLGSAAEAPGGGQVVLRRRRQETRPPALERRREFYWALQGLIAAEHVVGDRGYLTRMADTIAPSCPKKLASQPWTLLVIEGIW